ncbi:hypothetical protein RRG08_048659 [Elysia crispata]|uniref:Uncharacterized protein n=1 Tax=Elysia crispata TaxID=231223 RepID=A0AAE1ACR4_9GAST|nr:hypothetical protein RRG08_048659 [Elysia crispata]
MQQNGEILIICKADQPRIPYFHITGTGQVLPHHEIKSWGALPFRSHGCTCTTSLNCTKLVSAGHQCGKSNGVSSWRPAWPKWSKPRSINSWYKNVVLMGLHSAKVKC